MWRLFVGLALPAALTGRLSGLQIGLPDVRWVAVENLHLTLRFIGKIDETTAENVDDALSGIRAQPVQLNLKGVDCFHSPGKVRLLWAGVEPSTELIDLHGKVEVALSGVLGHPEGRKFTPHITLARPKRLTPDAVRPYLESHGGFRAGPVTIPEITLFRSHLSPKGVQYESLVTYPLGD